MKTPKPGSDEWIAAMTDMFGPMAIFDGFNDCLVGVCSRFGIEDHFIYDDRKIVTQLMRENTWDENEAEEFFDFNIRGAWIGDTTPSFLSR